MDVNELSRKDIQVCSKLSTVILQARNLESLTLDVSSKVGLGLAIHNIIPFMKNLKMVTLQLGVGKTRGDRMSAQSSTMYMDKYGSTAEMRRMLDKMLGQDAVFVESRSKPWMKVWVWKVQGKEVFKPKIAKKYIKFD